MSTDAWLTVVHAARSAVLRRLVREAGGAAALLALPDRSLAAGGADPQSLERLRHPDPAAIAAVARWLERPGRALVTIDSEHYPERLAATDDPPIALFVAGQSPGRLAGPQLAIVGSRNATRGGRETAAGFARHLGERGLTITSGLAAGIDAAAHEGALGSVGGTIAVFGCGLDTVFPREHLPLAKRIVADGGLLVSEYPPGVPPLAHQFPARNRIIAGLSVGTLVVEAGRRSGALNTARHANESGREVFAVPGSIHNPVAKGCHALIRSGAKLVEEGSDILSELAAQLELALAEPPPAAPGGPVPSALEGDDDYRNLLNALEFEPASIGLLADRSGLTAAEVSSMLLVLELDGLVEALPGGRYCRLK